MEYKEHHQKLEKPKKCPRCGRKNIAVTLTSDGFWKLYCNCDRGNPIYI